jgi:hypothetical protein
MRHDGLGYFFGWFAIIVATMFFAIAVVLGEHYWRLGWIGAVSGWWLTGLGLMALEKERRNSANGQCTTGVKE